MNQAVEDLRRKYDAIKPSPPSWLWAASAGCFGSAVAIIIAAIAFVVWLHWRFDGRGM